MIREFRESDAQECSELFITTINISNTHFSEADIVDLENHFRVDNIPVLAAKTRLYVFEIDGAIVATGAMSKDNLLSLMYVHPSYQQRGFGDEMMQFLLALVDDGMPIECNATDLAVSFYKKYCFEVLREVRYPHDVGDGELVFTRMIRK